MSARASEEAKMSPSEDTRTETDTFGPIEVPADRYWGAQTQRSLQNFRIGGERMPPPLVRALGLVKQAAARVNKDLGAARAARSPRPSRPRPPRWWPGKLDDEFPLVVWQTGSGTQTNMNANEVIAEPRQRAARRRARRQDAGPPERPRQSRPVLERHLPDRHAHRRGARDRRARCCRRCSTCTRRSTTRPRPSRTSSRSAAPISRTRRRSRSARNSPATPRRSALGIERVEGDAARALRRWRRAAPRSAPGSTPSRASPRRSPPRSRELTGLPFTTAPNKFEALAAHDALVVHVRARSTSARRRRCSRSPTTSACWAPGPRSGLGELIAAGERARLLDHAGQGQPDPGRGA